MELSSAQLRGLAEMLRSPDDDGDSSDDDLPPCALAKLGPGNIGPPKKAGGGGGTRVTASGGGGDGDGGGGGGGGVPGAGAGAGDPDAIWCPTEVASAPDDEDGADPRPRPEYDMHFRQAVTPEDVFLQLGGRTPGSASCEELVVRVRLPGERVGDVALSVGRQRVDVRSPAFRLALPLPHPVDADASRAHWDADAHTLTLSLRLVREFDFVNF
ncbi:hypothetical protein R5R35_006158 [Gryllus longicercus]|uniref:PIH1D1/2/3 CS-like domain-containing protein n=1 Tax=Gryllus longicercus TaxID=2509291 RepID=A0AAN9VIU8_9ORTH